VAEELTNAQGQCPVCGRLVEIPGGHAGGPDAAVAPLEVARSLGHPQSLGSCSTEYAEAQLPRWDPAAEEVTDWPDVRRPPYKLYTTGQVVLAAFLGGPVGAFILLAINYARLGKSWAVWGTIGLGVLTSLALMAISVALPDSPPGPILAIPLCLVVWGLARFLQGSICDAHVRAGGTAPSSWAAAGFGLLGMALFLGAFLPLYVVYEQTSLGTKIEFGAGEEIYFAQGATEADARALGAFLRQDGYFDGRGPKSVLLARDGDRMVISFVVQNWVLHDVHTQQQFRAIGQQAAQRALGGRPAEVRLCDEQLQVKKKL
jgi:hypothetical protein